MKLSSQVAVVIEGLCLREKGLSFFFFCALAVQKRKVEKQLHGVLRVAPKFLLGLVRNNSDVAYLVFY